MAYTRADKEQRFLPVVVEGSKTSAVNSISTIDAVNLAQTLSMAINKPAPRTWIGRWFQTRRIDLDGQRIDFLCAYIEKIKLVNQMATQVQAELTVAPQILEYIIQGNILRAQQEIELQVKSHQNELSRIQDEIEARGLQLDRVRAEIESQRANTHITKMQGRLLEKIVADLDINNISPAQAFVLIKSLNTSADVNMDFAAQEFMVKEQLSKMRAENEKLYAEARHKNAEANHAEAAAELKRSDVEAQIRENAGSRRGFGTT